MFLRSSRRLFAHATRRALGVAVAFFIVASALPAQAQKSGRTADEHTDSRIDFYAGYGYLHPIDSGINGYQYHDIYNPNVTASVTGWFHRYFGIQAEGSYFSGGVNHVATPVASCGFTTCNQIVYTAEGGPVVRLPLGRFIPFVHALAGGERLNGPAAQHPSWGWGVTGGIGIDYVLPFLNNRLAVRPVQADFQYAQVGNGPLVPPAGIAGGTGELDAVKLSGGLVVRFGEKGESQPVMLGCVAEPINVFPGDPVTVAGSTLYLNPRRPVQYTWTSNGGKVTPAESTATVDTTGLAPGEYTVQGHVSQGGKARQQASCAAPFTVKAMAPPSVTCMATPATATSGTAVDISTTGTSPQNRPLTYSYTTTAGQITGTGPTARLSTDGLGVAMVTVTCNVVDDLGQSAKATTTVSVEKPVPPVVPQPQPQCTIHFDRDARRPVRVDNEAKGCLDDIALAMKQDSSARLEVIGDASTDEKDEAAAERALNEREYLTREKGIDTTRIELRTGEKRGRNLGGRSVRNVLVPAGATFDETGTSPFDESAISRSGEAYGTGRGTPSRPAHKTSRSRRHRKTKAAAASLLPGVPLQ